MAEAGYYPDPDVPGKLRYFDGEAWTDEVVDAEASAPATTGDDTDYTDYDGVDESSLVEQQPRGLGDSLSGATTENEAALARARAKRRGPSAFSLAVIVLVVAIVAIATGAFGLGGADTPGVPQSSAPITSAPQTSAPATPPAVSAPVVPAPVDPAVSAPVAP